MALQVLDLFAKLSLDSSDYDKGLGEAKSNASSMGGSIASALGGGLKKVATVGVAAVGAATAAIGAFAKSSIDAGMDFDQSMSQVFATMGDKAEAVIKTGEYAGMKSSEALRDFAKEMGRTTEWSATQSADALNYMALAGYDATESMKMLPNVLNLASAGSMDLARASDMVTDAQTAFGLSIEQMSQLIDEMAKASSTGNTSVEQLGDAFLTVGGLAQELNGGMVTLADGSQKPVSGIQEMTIAMTAMANAGVKGSEAGTHMRNMLLKLASPTSEGTKALQEMGVAVFDTEGQMRSLSDIFGDLSGELSNMTQEEKIQAISELFNTRDLASAEALLNAVGQDWDEIGESILDADGAAEKMAATQLNNLAGDITIFQSALEGAKIAVSDELTPSLRQFVKFGTSGLEQITKAFESGGLTSAMKTLGNVLAEGVKQVAKVAPQAVSAGIQLVSAFGEGIVQNAPELMNAFLDIGAQVLNASANLMTQLAESMQSVDFGEIVTNIMSKITESFSSGSLGNVASAGLKVITSFISGMMEGIPALIQGGASLLDNLRQGVEANIGNFIPVAMNTIMEFSANLRESASTLVDSGLKLIMSIADGIIQNIPTLIKTIPTIIINIAGIINDNAPKLIATGVTIIVKLVAGIVKSIPTLIAEFPKIVQAIIAVITAVNWLNLGSTIIKGIVNGVKSLASSLPNALKEIGSKAVSIFKQINWSSLGSSLIRLIVTGIKGLANLIPNTLRSIGTAAINAIKNINWLDVGKNIVMGIVSGIKNFAHFIGDAIVGAIKGGKAQAESANQISSPSKVWRDDIGRYLGLGVAVGIKDTIPDVEEALTELTKATNMPDISNVSVDTNLGASGMYATSGWYNQVDEEEFFTNMADAFVRALERYGLTVEVDRREFGRVVRKEVLA